jgi:uncharacterized protein YndB with AHSA1/START domain/DNA-binding transcriptional ArsR family regulator
MPDAQATIFKALADTTRRRLLDRLFETDGQTLGELCAGLEMSRFGAMKHLRLLEQAHLVVTRRAGREKLHYLNPVPIRQIHDRWISKFREPMASALVRLKDALEGGPNVSPPRHLYEIFIRTTPEKLWEALTRPEMTEQYFYGSRLRTSLEPGAPLCYEGADGAPLIEGEVLEVVPLRRLVVTFRAVWAEQTRGDRPSRVTYEIEPRGEVCKLTLTHDDFDGETATYRSVGSGWNPVLSGLKTLLETGRPLEIPMPA